MRSFNVAGSARDNSLRTGIAQHPGIPVVHDRASRRCCARRCPAASLRPRGASAVRRAGASPASSPLSSQSSSRHCAAGGEARSSACRSARGTRIRIVASLARIVAHPAARRHEIFAVRSWTDARGQTLSPTRKLAGQPTRLPAWRRCSRSRRRVQHDIDPLPGANCPTCLSPRCPLRAEFGPAP